MNGWTDWRQKRADREYSRRERRYDRCDRCGKVRAHHGWLIRHVDACNRFLAPAPTPTSTPEGES